MERNLGLRPAHRFGAYSIALMIACIGFFAVEAGLQAQEREEAPALSELELAFWICDYTASTRRVDIATAVACGSISDDLKARKFGGDFDAMLAWWRRNKDSMHRATDLAARTVRKERAPASSEAGSP